MSTEPNEQNSVKLELKRKHFIKIKSEKNVSDFGNFVQASMY